MYVCYVSVSARSFVCVLCDECVFVWLVTGMATSYCECILSECERQCAIACVRVFVCELYGFHKK